MKKTKLFAIFAFAILTFSALLGILTVNGLDNPTITTDKPDYTPGETVSISGSGFDASGSYAIPVIRPDGGIVVGDGSFTDGWDNITADGSGCFTYPYILDGVEGLYTVRVYNSPWNGDLSALAIAETMFTDAKGDFSIDFCAAAPYSYDHATGGGAYDDGTIGKTSDVVESLEGIDFAAYDIVTYLVKVTVDDTTSAGTDAPQTLRMSFSFDTDTTGQSGVALGDVTYVGVNYGPIQDLIAGENTVDDGIVDDGGSTVSNFDETQIGTMFQSGSELHLVFDLDDLERNEEVVVRIDVMLMYDGVSNPTGNLQARFSGAQLIYIQGTVPVSPPQNVPGGAQTVPFLKIGDLYIANPSIDIEKYVSVDGGSNWLDADSATGPYVLVGNDVKFKVVVTNTGDVTLDGISVSDSDFAFTGIATSLAAGASDESDVLTVAAVAGQHENTATVSVTFDSVLYTDYDLAHYFGADPQIAVVKQVSVDNTNWLDADSATGPLILVGNNVYFRVKVTNIGNVPLSNVAVTDTDFTFTGVVTSLAVGAEDYSDVLTVASVAGQQMDTATASGDFTDDAGATRSESDTDDAYYFGADPQIAVVKTTADDYGNEGDGIAILPGETVTWKYLVTNVGNVPLSNVVVTDSQGVTVTCPKTTLAVGESMLCTASGTATVGWYNNIGTASGSFTDDAGQTGTDTDNDPSSYYGLTPGIITNSALCDFGSDFRLIFTPDMTCFTSKTPYYKLSDSNPGQFFYNLFQVNDGSVETYTLEIPYPFVTQGAMPVHVSGGVLVHECPCGSICFEPTNELAAYGYTFTLADYTDTNGDGKIGFGDTYSVHVPAELGFQYINIHLDYGLEKTDGWLKKGDNAVSDGTGKNPAPEGLTIVDNTAYTFNAYADSSLITDSTDTICNQNEYKQIRGFGGLVYYFDGTEYIPLAGAEVELVAQDGTVLETMTTDADGWYLSEYIHKGKTTTYTLRLKAGTAPTGPYSQQTVTGIVVGGSVKFGEGSFWIP
jgi:uncharacterized repeat protein (TIGR01451 family)